MEKTTDNTQMVSDVQKQESDETLQSLLDECQKMTEEMFRLQLKFNNETSGECWLDGVTKEGKKIDWINCIKMEACEMIDCLPWKHWKGLDVVADMDNFEVEMVDVWHFLMSEVIAASVYSSKKMHAENKTEFDDVAFETLMVEISRSISYETFYSSTVEDLKKDIDKPDLLLDVTKLFRDKTDTVDSLLSHFFAIQSIMQLKYGFTFKDLYKLYIGKNALNKFRQNNGYKDNTYLKVWPLKTGDAKIDANYGKLNGFEDNVFMKLILDKNPGLTFDELYAGIEKKYKEVLEANKKLKEEK